jgi:hypothetical protein
MKLKYMAWLLLTLCLTLILGCGNGAGGGEGLNGGLSLTATATGSVITAKATYTNPQTANVIGVPISFSYQIGNTRQQIPGVFNTNNSGSAGVAFTPAAFDGKQTVTVIATTGYLSNIASVEMTGRSITLTPPTAAAQQTTDNPLVTPTNSIPIPASASFITVTDPFSSSLAGHSFNITYTVTSTATASLALSATTTITDAFGNAPFPGATATLAVPSTVGGVNTMTINWTATEPSTGMTASGTTTITLTKSA